MKRILLLAAVLAFLAPLCAQEKIVATTVSAGPNGWFWVDGQLFKEPTVFMWPEGSKHILSTGPMPEFGFPPGKIKWECSGDASWTDSRGAKLDGPTIAVTAHPDITWYATGNSCEAWYSLRLEFCGSVGARMACIEGPEYGKVYMDGQCYSQTSEIWVKPNTLVDLQAYPPPGWVFKGWPTHLPQSQAYHTTLPVTGSMVIMACFEPAIPVEVLTSPAGMQVLVDTTPVAGPAYFDWAANSTHALAPVSPQRDRNGMWWVFDAWEHGGEPIQQFKVGLPPGAVTISARYLPGVPVPFGTQPLGLKLFLDGSDWPPNYTRIWALGSTHTVSAPLEQLDSNGRMWVFREWSDGGEPEHEITVNPAGSPNGATAFYDLLGRLTIRATKPGVTVLVDDAPCATPCAVHRRAGSTARISVPATVQIDERSRFEFRGWAGGGTGDRTWTAGTQDEVWELDYVGAHRLQVSADPAAGAVIHLQPPSPDGFYRDGTDVTIHAEAKTGYEFRYWEGDLDGIGDSRVLTIWWPCSVLAVLERVPFVAITEVRNAAGEPAEPGLAPGSVISIFGGGLAASYEKGPDSPLAQVLNGVTVQVGQSILPLFFVSPEQINAVLPSNMPDGEYLLTVRPEDASEIQTVVNVRRNAPGLFTHEIDGRDFALASHEDGTPVTPESPARRGETVTLLGTGFGPYQGGALDGFMVPEGMLLRLADPVEIRIGEHVLEPASAMAAAGYVGMSAVRFRIGEDLPQDATVELKAAVNGQESNTVLLPLE